MIKDFNKLFDIAKSLCGQWETGSQVTVARVSSALLTDKGDIFTGVSIEAPCGMGFCAEHSAISEMLKQGQSRIKFILAVDSSGVIPPCGRCRELIRQVDKCNFENTAIAISDEEDCLLKQLLPSPFIQTENA